MTSKSKFQTTKLRKAQLQEITKSMLRDIFTARYETIADEFDTAFRAWLKEYSAPLMEQYNKLVKPLEKSGAIHADYFTSVPAIIRSQIMVDDPVTRRTAGVVTDSYFYLDSYQRKELAQLLHFTQQPDNAINSIIGCKHETRVNISTLNIPCLLGAHFLGETLTQDTLKLSHRQDCPDGSVRAKDDKHLLALINQHNTAMRVLCKNFYDTAFTIHNTLKTAAKCDAIVKLLPEAEKYLPLNPNTMPSGTALVPADDAKKIRAMLKQVA
jgi:hypothetical protein